MGSGAATSAVVFGGAGFIGRHVAHALLARGYGVVLCDLAPPAWPRPAGMEFARCDVRAPIELELPAPPLLVVNLAAIHRTPGHADAEYHETNESGARNVTAFCARHAVPDLWFTSSIAVYGPSEAVMVERSPLRAETAYGRSKLAAEAIHEAWARDAPGRRLVIVRPGTVFGPGEGGNFSRLAWALARRRFAYPGRRDTVKACGYVGELVQTLFFMQEHAAPVVTYNFSYGPPPTIEQVCAAFAEVGGLPRPLGTVPLPLMLAAARVLHAVGLESFRPERVHKLNRSTNIHPAELDARGYRFSTDLRTGLAAWRDAPPRGQFV